MKKCFFVTSLLTTMWALNNIIFENVKKSSKSDLKEKTFSWRYGEISYVTAGEGEPVLLLHEPSIGGGLHEWDKIIGPLSKKYKVYAIDLLGFGNSDKPAISYSAYMYVRLIIDFIETIIKEPVQVYASSQSADFTVLASAFNEEAFSKMILINPVGIDNEPPNRKDKALRFFMELPIVGTSLYCFLASKYYIKYSLKKHVYSDSSVITKELVDKYYKTAHLKGADSKYAAAAFLSKSISTDIYSKLSNIAVPTNIVLSLPRNTLNTIALLKKIENKEIKISFLENAKRLPHLEKPKHFFRIY